MSREAGDMPKVSQALRGWQEAVLSNPCIYYICRGEDEVNGLGLMSSSSVLPLGPVNGVTPWPPVLSPPWHEPGSLPLGLWSLARQSVLFTSSAWQIPVSCSCG